MEKNVEKKNEIGRPEKYTFEYCFNEVIKLFDMLYNDNENIPKYYFLQDLIRTRPYSVQRWSEWKKNERFKSHQYYEEFSEAIKKIEEELLNRIIKGALTGSLNPTIAIFVGKTTYKMIEHGKQIYDTEDENEKETEKQNQEQIKDNMNPDEAAKIYKDIIKKSKGEA